MRILIVDTYYRDFRRQYRERHPGRSRLPYAEQWQLLMNECFGTADFYSKNLAQLGHEAAEIVANDESLQRRWALEQGLSLPMQLFDRHLGPLPIPWLRRDWFAPVLLAQAKAFRPDAIHVQDPNGIPFDLTRELRKHTRLLTAQIASPYSEGADFSAYNLMLSSFPHFVDRFRKEGIRSEYFQLGFEPAILPRLAQTEPRRTVFVGGLSNVHRERVQFFEELARRTLLDWWGYGVNELSADSPMRRAYRGPAWGLEMYGHLRNAKIAINSHINVAGRFANNMRLYEATGVGALLLTDWKENLGGIFEVGKEVRTYHSTEECCEVIDYYLAHEDERAALARRGQQRTLSEHTYHHRMRQYLDIIKSLL